MALNRFETFTSNIDSLYRCIQKIKKLEMQEFSLKGRTVMCLFYLYQHPDGMTVSELSQATDDDMAGISRAVQELRDHEMAQLETDGRNNRYRAKVVLTPKGIETAASVNAKAERAVEGGGASLTDEERSTFYHALTTVSAHLSVYTQALEAEKKAAAHMQQNGDAK